VCARRRLALKTRTEDQRIVQCTILYRSVGSQSSMLPCLHCSRSQHRRRAMSASDLSSMKQQQHWRACDSNRWGFNNVTNRGSLAHTHPMTNWLLVIFGGVLLADQVSANAACCRVNAVPFFAKDEGLLDGSIIRIHICIYTSSHTD
jgi:hypothetical protein